MIFIILLLVLVVLILLISIGFADEIRSTKERDPAAKNGLEVILLYPGLHAVIAYRISHFFHAAKVRNSAIRSELVSKNTRIGCFVFHSLNAPHSGVSGGSAIIDCRSPLTG